MLRRTRTVRTHSAHALTHDQTRPSTAAHSRPPLSRRAQLSDGASHRYIVENFDGKLTTQAQQSLRGGTDLNCGALYGEQVLLPLPPFGCLCPSL